MTSSRVGNLCHLVIQASRRLSTTRMGEAAFSSATIVVRAESSANVAMRLKDSPTQGQPLSIVQKSIANVLQGNAPRADALCRPWPSPSVIAIPMCVLLITSSHSHPNVRWPDFSTKELDTRLSSQASPSFIPLSICVDMTSITKELQTSTSSRMPWLHCHLATITDARHQRSQRMGHFQQSCTKTDTLQTYPSAQQVGALWRLCTDVTRWLACPVLNPRCLAAGKDGGTRSLPQDFCREDIANCTLLTAQHQKSLRCSWICVVSLNVLMHNGHTKGYLPAFLMIALAHMMPYMHANSAYVEKELRVRDRFVCRYGQQHKENPPLGAHTPPPGISPRPPLHTRILTKETPKDKPVSTNTICHLPKETRRRNQFNSKRHHGDTTTHKWFDLAESRRIPHKPVSYITLQYRQPMITNQDQSSMSVIFNHQLFKNMSSYHNQHHNNHDIVINIHATNIFNSNIQDHTEHVTNK